MRAAAQMPGKKFDWIKIDIEGEEKQLFNDESSCLVLCEARCIMMELHDFITPGCQAAFDAFLANGCDQRQTYFRHIATTGEYHLYCKG